MTIDMRALRVDYGNADTKKGITTIFVPLPRAAWLPLDRCNCANCDGRPAWWDTLAIQRTPDGPGIGQTSTTWLVHRPEGHPFHDQERNASFGVHFYTKPESVPFVALDVHKPVAFAPLGSGLNIIEQEAEHANRQAERNAAQAIAEGKDAGR